jgi:hypothetical protein
VFLCSSQVTGLQAKGSELVVPKTIKKILVLSNPILEHIVSLFLSLGPEEFKKNRPSIILFFLCKLSRLLLLNSLRIRFHFNSNSTIQQ